MLDLPKTNIVFASWDIKKEYGFNWFKYLHASTHAKDLKIKCLGLLEC